MMQTEAIIMDVLMGDEKINQSMLLEFNSILKNGTVTTLYQPIVGLQKAEVHAYEALSRGPENSILHSPLVLLSVAELLNKTWELEQLLRIKALENATFTNEFQLFLNVDPNIIKDPKFIKGFTKENLLKMNIAPHAIVLELTERSAIESYDDFKEILKHYKDQGYQIAIDDVGSGYSGLKTLYEVYPKYLKIDMDFIRNIDTDKFKQAIVKSFIEMSKGANIKTVAEGIETLAELKMVIGLGVDYGQGFYLQRPLKSIKPLNDFVIKAILKENALVTQTMNYSQEYHYIHHIMQTYKAYESHQICKDVFDYLNSSATSSVAVIENNRPVGLVTANEINRVFAKQFGYSVYSHRPIELIMDKLPMIVDYYTPINEVAKRALKRNTQHLYDDILVRRGLEYAGIVTMKALLEYAINYEKNYAKELNPLTGLPGNMVIKRVLTRTIESYRPSCVLYVDIDNFKVFNDVYGFEKGDQILKMTSEILKKCMDDCMPYNSFLGHIGGDDFIVITKGDMPLIQDFCLSVIKNFDAGMKYYLSEEDLTKGSVEAFDREGVLKNHALTSISLAGLLGPMRDYVNTEQVSKDLALIKKEVKQIKSSAYKINTLS